MFVGTVFHIMATDFNTTEDGMSYFNLEQEPARLQFENRKAANKTIQLMLLTRLLSFVVIFNRSFLFSNTPLMVKFNILLITNIDHKRSGELGRAGGGESLTILDTLYYIANILSNFI